MLASKRLEALRLLYQNESCIWDIGCDHGLLGSSFAYVNEVVEIHLVDPSEAVIVNLKDLIDSYITKTVFKLTLHHQRGQDLRITGSSNCIFIAGMGGKEIGEIALSLGPQVDHHSKLVISPHRNILELRERLAESEWRMENEMLVEEGGRLYQIMVLRKDHNLPSVSPYGIKIWQGAWGQQYRLQQQAHFQEHRDDRSIGYCRFLSNL